MTVAGKFLGAFLLTIGLLLACKSALAQDSWVHMYGNCGFNVQCSRSLHEQDVAMLPDGGFLVGSPRGDGGELGTRDALQVLRLDRNGNLVWARQYAQQAILYSLLANPDGGFFLIATDFAYGPQPPRRILRCDPQGAVLWDKLYVEAGNWSGAVHTRDGNFVVYDYNGRLTKIATDTGEILWDWGYFTPNEPIPRSYPTHAVRESADGGLLLLMDASPDGVLLLKVDEDGGVLWCKQFPDLRLEQDQMPWIHYSVGDGFVFTAYYRAQDPEPVLLWIDGQGNLTRAKRMVWVGDANPATLVLSGAQELADGSVIAIGGANDMKVLFKADPQGNLLWDRGWGYPTPMDAGIRGLFPVSGGVVLVANGDDFGENFSAEALLKLDSEGHGIGECRAERSGNIGIVDIALTEEQLTGFERATNPYLYTVDNASWSLSVNDIVDRVICGEEYPGIMTVKKLNNPFRLKLSGWRFKEGSTVFIGGVQAPLSKFKGANRLGITKLVAKGHGLKSLLPKGQAVSLEVKNPDGLVSASVSFTR